MGDAERVYINALITLLHNHDVDLTEELEIDLQNFVETMIEEISNG